MSIGVGRRCLVCGLNDCGHTSPAASASVVPVDIPPRQARGAPAMPEEIRDYEVVINGTRATLRLNERDAKRLKAKPLQRSARASARPGPGATKAAPETKAHQPANKAHTPEAKHD